MKGSGLRAKGFAFVALAFVVTSFVGRSPEGLALHAQQDFSVRSAAPVTFLQINDVYSTVPIDGVGGLARVATLKQNLAAAGRTPFLVMAGDFLSPSVASSVFKGEQMIAALNAAGLDMATLGNHEFDFGDDELIKRMGEATFEWVVSNVVDTNTGKPIGGAKPFVVKSFGGLKVGFIGLCLTTQEITADKLKHTKLVNPMVAAGRYLRELKKAGATVIVAVTHLAIATDRELVERYPEIDLVIGGHEHYLITDIDGKALISKAGSDAKAVARIDVNRRPGGTTERFYELLPITSALADDAKTAGVIAAWESRLGPALDSVVGSTAVPLDGVNLHLHSSETNLGNLVADAIRADGRADLAIVNAGSLRGNRLYPAGPLTRRRLLEIHPFNNVVTVVAVPGRIVLAALNHGVSMLPVTNGRFPQVSGVTMEVDATAAVGSRVRHVEIAGQPLDLGKTYTVAISDFVMRGGDDYTMFKGQPVTIAPEAGDTVSAAIEKYIASQGTIAPAVEHRIIVR